jgi:two-component system response regulator PhoP
MRVLVIEDEARLANNIAVALREGPGYAVDIASDGQTAIQLLHAAEYDLVLLDLMLPKFSGERVLEEFRTHDETTPVLVLTAVTGTKSTIQLLDSGADDYMTKPFDLGELISRARALVRRGKGVKSTILRLGEIGLDSTKQVVSLNEVVIDLSPTEYRILEYLMHRSRMIVSKRELLEHLYDFTWEHHSNVIEAHVSNLRRKLKTGSSTILLETYRGRGYRLAALAGGE